MRNRKKLPKGWDEKRIKMVLAHYEAQTEEDAVAEDESVFKDKSQTMMEVPVRLVPVVREIIARDEAGRRGRVSTRRKTK
ncbi:MAG: hypothetical protein A3J24_11015 [Deltaproteobacteria bacterium RIFCSPLOWO2_02_FULL_53_8]|nr:MAG: hypothetical protein A3J24_11015 [Deltaproteobacteria bacterium RIFCSPLOWO2_02_FULL_53_8]